MSMHTIHNRIIIKTILVYMCAFLCMGSCSSIKATNQATKEHYTKIEEPFSLHDHYQKLCDCIVNVWTVLDIMRSINIEPKARVHFIHKLFDDVIGAMREVVILEIGCRLDQKYGQQYSEELHYFFDMTDHLENAFQAVFTPIIFGEEHLLALLMIELFTGVRTIKGMLSHPEN